MRDHPRLRGEKIFLFMMGCIFLGSPPLTRGKEAERLFKKTAKRITPAYAGKSPSLLPLLSSVQDHPRLRGEKLSLKVNVTPVLGSPPLTRGKDCRKKIWRKCWGITPAYAGKSRIPQNIVDTHRDHPRLRGEKMAMMAYAYRQEGSPPLTRGKEILAKRISSSAGITPAYAGKSLYCLLLAM